MALQTVKVQLSDDLLWVKWHQRLGQELTKIARITADRNGNFRITEDDKAEAINEWLCELENLITE